MAGVVRPLHRLPNPLHLPVLSPWVVRQAILRKLSMKGEGEGVVEGVGVVEGEVDCRKEA